MQSMFIEMFTLILNLHEILYLLLGQCIQLLDVRGDERVQSAQNLIYRQGRQEETQSLHQPHALAALHTDTQQHVQYTSYMMSSERRLVDLFSFQNMM